jgi:hypothetical protein
MRVVVLLLFLEVLILQQLVVWLSKGEFDFHFLQLYIAGKGQAA